MTHRIKTLLVVSGLLMGIGLTILLLSLIALYIVQIFYAPIYPEIMNYTSMINEVYTSLHSPNAENILRIYKEVYELGDILDVIVKSYSELVEFEPSIEDAVKKYREIYPNLVAVEKYMDWLYNTTHSNWYAETLDVLQMLSSYENVSGIGSIIRVLNPSKLLEVMKALKEASTVAKKALQFIKSLPLSEIEKYVKEFKKFIKILPPDKLEAYVKSLKLLLQQYPPEELENYLQQARLSSEKALTMITNVEKYPPEKLLTYIYACLAFSIILMISGLIIVLKMRGK